MTTYRAFRLNKHREIRSGAWVHASNDAAALAQAKTLCEDGAPFVEIWRGERLVDEVECARAKDDAA